MIDSQSLIPLLLSIVAGFSTVLGAFIVFFSKSENKRLITFALSFSAGVMLTVSFTDLFPTAESSLSKYLGNFPGILFSLLFLLVGALIAMLIDKFVPEDEKSLQLHSSSKSGLYRVGFVSMVAIMLHNLPEGIATFVSGYQDTSLGLYITLAIALHNIPEGISVAMPIYYSTGSKLKAFKFTFLSGMAEPLGAFLAFLLLKPFINELILGIIFAIVCGIMIYIAFQELIPTARKYNYPNIYLLGLLTGICLIPISHILLK